MATVTLNMYILLFLSSFLFGRLSNVVSAANQIKLGDSLSPTIQPTSLRSPSGRFAFGFYKQGSKSFKVGTWFFGNDASTNIIIWTANRDDPPVSSNSKLVLTNKGELLLQTGRMQKKNGVIAHSENGTVYSASLLDTGNFMIKVPIYFGRVLTILLIQS